MGVLEAARAHYRRRGGLARRAARLIGSLWRQVDPTAIAATWRPLLPQAYGVLSVAQSEAAGQADAYAAAVLGDVAAAGLLVPARLAGIASDGRDLTSLLEQPVITALTDLAGGSSVARAMDTGALELDMIVRTQVADAGRVADGVAVAARRSATGYVRMLQLPSCSRCIILAGVFYEWSDGFKRHPRCDCIHVPADEDTPDDVRTNPQQVFDAMSEAEQDKVFTVAGAQAIRDGADIAQVVNARRGAAGLTPAGARITAEEAEAIRGGKQFGHLRRTDIFGQQLFVTTEGTTVRGDFGRSRKGGPLTRRPGQRVRSTLTPRLMPESIYEIAGDDRDEAIRLLKRFGYIR